MTNEAITVAAVYVAFLAVVVAGIWVYGVISDRLHARRMVARFDLFVATLERRRREGAGADG
jgi:hypothetical protein